MVPAAANPSQPDQSTSIRFRLLGPLTVLVNDEPVPLGGPRQMAVLARLMLTPDHVVTMDQLVDSVWDGDEPAQPHVAIRSYVSNLRRAIEPNRRRRSTDSCLVSSPPGYRLAVEPGSIDWVGFENLTAAARSRLGAGDPAASVGMLREALALWTGVPFSGLPESHYFQAHQSRLSEQRETAVELLFEALLADGDHRTVAAEVDSAIAESPLRERLTELGMLAFYRSGRQSEALALGQRLRARLLDKLGVDPSPSIEAVELKILNHDSSLKPTGPPARPSDRPERAAPSQGTHRDGGAEAGHALGPVRPVGRHAEMAALGAVTATLLAGRSATAIVTGEQGIGKTTLARAVADSAATNGIRTVWSWSVAEDTGPLWPWAQIVGALLGSHRDVPPVEVTADLASLAELGPSVARALAASEPSSPAHPEPGRTPRRGSGRAPAPIPDGPPLADHWPPPSPEATAATERAMVDDGSDRAEIMLAVTGLLDRVAAVTPVLLLFEDLHLADQRSVALLSYVAESLTDRPVGFLLTWRETDLAPGPGAARLRRLSRLSNLVRLELEGIPGAAVGDLAQDLSRPVAAEVAQDLHRRSDGNPLFLRELLSHTDPTIGDGRQWSVLIDAVMDRVERIHPSATSVLTAAALFKAPFTVDMLAPLCDESPETVHQVVDDAVVGRVLEEDGPAVGSYRFRQPVVAEVLTSRIMPAARARTHQAIGHGLLRSAGPGYEVAHHLGRSPAAEDRLLAGRIALAAFLQQPDGHRLTEIDQHVDGALRAAGRRGPADPDGARFLTEAKSYRSLRAWLDGEPAQWLEHGRRAMQGALQLPPVGGRAASRTRSAGKGRETARDPYQTEVGDPADPLERAALNLIGSPAEPVGPTMTSDFAPLAGDDHVALVEAADRLPTDSPARWAVHIHLSFLSGLEKPGLDGQAKALREAAKTATAAAKRLSDRQHAVVLRVLLSRFSHAMDAEARLSMTDDLARLDPGLPNELFRTRHTYPALLEAGRSFDAERRTEATLHRSIGAGDPLQVAEARLLWIRHLLWTGQLDVADDELDQATADWATLGLPEAVPLLRQRRTLRLLRRHPITEGHGPDFRHQLLDDQASKAELGLRLARMGDVRRATECLDGVLESVAVAHCNLADQALMAAASAVAGHEKAALTAHELLVPYGDRLIVRNDGSVVIGPASLYAGLGARAAGKMSAGAELIEAGVAAVHRLGGSGAAADALLHQLDTTINSN